MRPIALDAEDGDRPAEVADMRGDAHCAARLGKSTIGRYDERRAKARPAREVDLDLARARSHRRDALAAEELDPACLLEALVQGSPDHVIRDESCERKRIALRVTQIQALTRSAVQDACDAQRRNLVRRDPRPNAEPPQSVDR